MRWSFIFLFLIVTPVFASAQHLSNNGRFQVDEIKGCSPFRVTLVSTVTPFQTTWGDGAGGPDSTVHTFKNFTNAPITRRISLLYPPPQGSDFIDIVVLPNIAPSFDIYTCNGQAVQVKVTDINYDSYMVDFGDGSMDATILGAGTTPYTYAAPGAYTINVRGRDIGAADNCTPAPKPVTTVNTLPAPTINLLTVTSDAQMDLTFTGTSNVQYRVEYARNSSTTGFQFNPPLIHDVSTATITNSTIRAEQNYYCTRLGAFSPCSNTTVAYSNVVCTAKLDNPVAVSNAINLSWNTSTAPALGVSNFDVRRDGSSLAGPQPISPFSYSDQTVVCKTSYRYQLITNYSNGSQSISIEKQPVTAFSSDTPTGILDVTALVDDSGVTLSWSQDPDFQPNEYSIARKSGSGSYEHLTKTNALTITDPNYMTSQEFCYRINYFDVCDVLSAPGVDICPIRLTGKVVVDPAGNRSITLDWSEYEGWASDNSLTYFVEKYDDEGVMTDRIDMSSLLAYEEDATVNIQQYRYVIVAEADPGQIVAISNDKVITLDPIAIFPKAFTPNGDNYNDEYKVIVPENYQYIDHFEMKIFNRWGEMIFTTNDAEKGWDGKYKGSNQAEGVYIFTATLKDLSGHTFKRSGSFVLLRTK